MTSIDTLAPSPDSSDLSDEELAGDFKGEEIHEILLYLYREHGIRSCQISEVAGSTHEPFSPRADDLLRRMATLRGRQVLYALSDQYLVSLSAPKSTE